MLDRGGSSSASGVDLAGQHSLGRGAATAGTSDDGSLRVVIVDDDPELRQLARALLSRDGRWHVVGEAGDGAHGLKLLALLQPDVCLLDVRMPVPGDAVLPYMIRAAPSCMIAVYSGGDSEPDRTRLLALGAFAFYPKSQSADLADRLAEDYLRFASAIGGYSTLPRWLENGHGPSQG